MPHDARAYLADIVESCAAIQAATRDLTITEYKTNRLIRSSVEREFILIGEAMAALDRATPKIFASITKARRIVDFRNQLTHEYATVDNAIVWAIVENGCPGPGKRIRGSADSTRFIRGVRIRSLRLRQ